MVAHAVFHVLDAQLAVGHDPERHVLSIWVLALCPRQIAVEGVVEMAEEAPHTRFAETASAEVGERIGVLPGEVFVLALEPSHLSRIFHHVLRIEHVLLVLHVELADAALVGMCADGIVGNAQGDPHHAL